MGPQQNTALVWSIIKVLSTQACRMSQLPIHALTVLQKLRNLKYILFSYYCIGHLRAALKQLPVHTKDLQNNWLSLTRENSLNRKNSNKTVRRKQNPGTCTTRTHITTSKPK